MRLTLGFYRITDATLLPAYGRWEVFKPLLNGMI